MPAPFSLFALSLMEYSTVSPSTAPALAKVSHPCTALPSVIVPVPVVVVNTLARLKTCAILANSHQGYAIGAYRTDHSLNNLTCTNRPVGAGKAGSERDD